MQARVINSISTGVNVHELQVLSSPNIGILHNGDSIEVLTKSSAWITVRIPNGKIGYVSTLARFDYSPIQAEPLSFSYIPLRELGATKTQRAQLATYLRWFADVLEHFPSAEDSQTLPLLEEEDSNEDTNPLIITTMLVHA